MIKRINLISGPRNISTALMYAFDNRSDACVVDEPMYAYYLKKSGVQHPGRDAILNEMPQSIEGVLKNIIFKKIDCQVYFIKGMAHHYLDMDLSFLLKLDNVFLIRDPRLLIRSFAKIIESPTSEDIGLKREWELYQYLVERNQAVVVLDSGEILKNPSEILQKLCENLNIPFQDRMLSWPTGARPVDGIWAKYWYSSVHRSTGFQKPSNHEEVLPSHLMPLYEKVLPFYNALFEQAIKA